MEQYGITWEPPADPYERVRRQMREEADREADERELVRARLEEMDEDDRIDWIMELKEKAE